MIELNDLNEVIAYARAAADRAEQYLEHSVNPLLGEALRWKMILASPGEIAAAAAALETVAVSRS